MYYLIGYDDTVGTIKHYRVDKMLKIETLQEKREGKTLFEEKWKNGYFIKTFGMFGGTEERIRLRVEKSLIGVMIDRFGKDVFMRPDGENHAIVSADIVYSKQFLGWLYGLGAGIQVISPQYIADDMKNRALEIAKLYE